MEDFYTEYKKKDNSNWKIFTFSKKYFWKEFI